MHELIELTGAEIAAAKTGITVTLKELSERFNIRHDNLKVTFENEVNKLTEENISLLSFRSQTYEAKTGKNTVHTYNTYELDIKTAVWITTKFDANLRMQIVNYAFTKLEEEHKDKVVALEKSKKKLEKTLSSRFNQTGEFKSLSKLRYELGLQEEYSVADLYELLEEHGDVRTEVVTTKKRILTSSNGIEDTGGNPRFTAEYLMSILP